MKIMPTLIKLKRSVTGNPLQPAQKKVELDEGEPFVDTYSKALVVGGKKNGSTKDKIGDHYVNDVWVDTYQPLVRSDENPVVIGNTYSTLRVQKGKNPIEGIRPIELVSDSRIVMQATGNNDIALYGESIYLCPKTPDMSDTYLSTLAVYDNRSNVVNVQINESYGLRIISQYSTNCVGEILLGNTGGITMRANTTNQSQDTTEVTIGDGQVMVGNGGLLVDGPSTIQGLAYVQSLKIGNSNIGSSSQPVYVNNGTITPCDVRYISEMRLTLTGTIETAYDEAVLNFISFSTEPLTDSLGTHNIFVNGWIKGQSVGRVAIVDWKYENGDYKVFISGNTAFSNLSGYSASITKLGSHVY